jgi:hypothetical protein
MRQSNFRATLTEHWAFLATSSMTRLFLKRASTGPSQIARNQSQDPNTII